MPPETGRRVLIGVIIAAAVIAAYVAVLYLAAAWLLPRMPGWGMAVVAIIGALLFIMSPFTAIKVYDRAVRRPGSSPGRSTSGDDE